MYALSPQASGIHIRQIPPAHVTTYTCTLCLSYTIPQLHVQAHPKYTVVVVKCIFVYQWIKPTIWNVGMVLLKGNVATLVTHYSYCTRTRLEP